MAKGASAQRHTCPACGTVGSFPAGKPLVCKVCGTPIPSGDAPAAPRLMVAPQLGLPGHAREQPPTALAAIALGCGILAFVTLWVTPLSLLLITAALVCGIVALARSEGDTGVQVMAGIGVGLAALILLLTWWAWMLHGMDGGSSVEFSSSGDTYEDDGGSSGSGGGGGGGSEGSGGQGGGSGGEGGGSGGGAEEPSGGSSSEVNDSDGGSGASDSGGDVGGGVGGDVDAGGDVESPMPVALLSGLGLLAAAAWRRRV